MGWHLGVSLGTMLRSSIQFLLSGSRDLDLGPLKSRAPVVRSGAHQGRAGAAQAAHRRKDAGIRGAGLRKAQRLQRTQCPVPRSTICEEARPKRRFVSSRTKTMMSPGPAARVGVLGVVGLFGPRCMQRLVSFVRARDKVIVLPTTPPRNVAALFPICY